MPGQKENTAFQKEELDSLTVIYCDEIKIIKELQPYKFKIVVKPLLEDDNYQHHYDYDSPELSMTIEMPKEYPEKKPKYYFETSHPRIACGTNIADLTVILDKLITGLEGEPCIMEIIEFVRKFLYTKIARKNQHFKKRRHIFNDDYQYIDDDDSDDEGPELAKKETFTPVTFASFNDWRIGFNSQKRAAKMEDKDYITKQALLLKQSGKSHFEGKAKDLAAYILDEKEEGYGDDVTDVQFTGKDIIDDNAEPQIEIDEGAFNIDTDSDDSSLGDVFD